MIKKTLDLYIQIVTPIQMIDTKPTSRVGIIRLHFYGLLDYKLFYLSLKYPGSGVQLMLRVGKKNQPAYSYKVLNLHMLMSLYLYIRSTACQHYNQFARQQIQVITTIKYFHKGYCKDIFIYIVHNSAACLHTQKVRVSLGSHLCKNSVSVCANVYSVVVCSVKYCIIYSVWRLEKHIYMHIQLKHTLKAVIMFV